MPLIQLELGLVREIDMDKSKVLKYYDKYAHQSLELMKRKNHDYNEAWRSMRISSFTDLILRNYTGQTIEDHQGTNSNILKV